MHELLVSAAVLRARTTEEAQCNKTTRGNMKPFSSLCKDASTACDSYKARMLSCFDLLPGEL